MARKINPNTPDSRLISGTDEFRSRARALDRAKQAESDKTAKAHEKQFHDIDSKEPYCKGGRADE